MNSNADTPQTSFSDLLTDPSLLARLAELEFQTPTDIQSLALPVVLSGKDAILQAKTGSGKTLAFVLPLIHAFNEKKFPDTTKTYALFIAPTRELALQIQDVFQEMCPEIAPVLVIGGVDEKKQKNAIKRDARIIVGTPGRLLDLLQRKAYSLKHCSYFVLDEADEMLSMGFIEDVRAILSRLPKRRQGLFVSATISPRVEMLAHSFLSKADYLVAEVDEDDKPAIDHLYCEVSGDLMAKPSALCDIIETQRPRSAIIFCNTKSDTQLVEVLLRRRGFDARRINSDLSQSQRQKVLAKIKSRDLQLLVATDIAARGIDIEQLDLVINYALHDQSDTYIHRTGRTGRAGLTGRAISLVGPRDFGAFHYLTKVVDVEFEKMPLPSDEEVADARLSHVYEMLREKETKVDTRAKLAAAKLLKDHGTLTEVEDDLLEIIGKLCEFTIGHAVAEEAKSLDEELEAESRDKGKDQEKDKKTSKDRKKDKPRKEASGEDDAERKGTEKRSDKRDRNADSESVRVRLYVGQGSEQGLSEDSFQELAAQKAEVDVSDIRRVSVRKQYSYVDTSLEIGERLLTSLAGVEMNGKALPIQIAARYESKPRNNRRSSNRNSRGGNRSSGGGNRSRRQNNRRSNN